MEFCIFGFCVSVPISLVLAYQGLITFVEIRDAVRSLIKSYRAAKLKLKERKTNEDT